jgi:hypothetical protein
MKIPEKEILINRFYYGEMDKTELSELEKRLLLEMELESGLPCRWSL